MEYIRKKVPIQRVAQALGISVSGKAAHCWRTDNHHHGDRNASIWFTRYNRGRCHVCDAVSWSCIDLVMKVNGISAGEAARWIAKRFRVPSIPKGRHLSERQTALRYRVGAGDVLEFVVRSGLFADLSGAQAKVLQVLTTFAEGGVARISYLGIMRYAGIASYSTVSDAVRRFQKMHFLAVTRPKGSHNFRACNEYRLTPEDERFAKLANDMYQAHRAKIEAQRSLREQQRTRKTSADPRPAHLARIRRYLSIHAPTHHRHPLT
jgi:hypothetical protein